MALGTVPDSLQPPFSHTNRTLLPSPISILTHYTMGADSTSIEESSGPASMTLARSEPGSTFPSPGSSERCSAKYSRRTRLKILMLWPYLFHSRKSSIGRRSGCLAVLNLARHMALAPSSRAIPWQRLWPATNCRVSPAISRYVCTARRKNQLVDAAKVHVLAMACTAAPQLFLYTACIPADFLDGFDQPSKAAPGASVTTACYTLSLQRPNSLPRRLLFALHAPLE